MDAKTLEAVKKSIRKWNKKKVVDYAGNNCALCQEFGGPADCQGCPVAERAGMNGCVGTPYVAWANHHTEKHKPYFPYKTECPVCVKLQQAELDFLKSLLPEETK